MISVFCYVKYGYCICKNGYFGEFCNCKIGVYICNFEMLYCYISERGEVVCFCKFYLLIINKEECFSM